MWWSLCIQDHIALNFIGRLRAAKYTEGCTSLVQLLQKVSNLWKRVLKLELCKTILAFDIFEKWGIDAIGPLPITS